MWRSAAWCAPYCLFVIIGMKVSALGFPVHHAPFKRCHQWEELVLPVFNDVWPLMAIHINPLLYPRVPPSKCKKPLLCCALRQPVSDDEPKRWENIFIKGMMELLEGH